MGDVAEVVAKAAPLAEPVEPRDLEPARGRPQSRREDAKQGRLARPVVAEHRDVLARVQDQVDPLERKLAAEAMGQAIGDDDAHGRSGGVLSRGQSTNGPARNRSSVATIRAIATRGE